LGPLVFLIVHAYVLLHFVLLAGKVGAFHAELQAQIAGDDARARLRRQLPSNIFVQSLAGPREVRTGIIGFLLRLIVQISLVAGPIALLILFQLQFLPYHNEWITSWQRIAVVIDLILLWLLWPPIARGDTTQLRLNDFERVKVQAWALVSLLPILLVFTIATFPSEWLEENLLSMPLVPTTWAAVLSSDEKALRGWTTLHELLVAGAVNYVTDSPKSLWSNVLVLPDFKAGDRVKFDAEGKIAIGSDALSLRGRDLQGAVFVRAHLDKADFTDARLQSAVLTLAELREAKFWCDSVGGEQKCAQLQGANLTFAQLQGARLVQAQLQGATLDTAQLQGADLERAQLQGALLLGAQLQGARLVQAQLHGAWLLQAQLQGANLDTAQLQGADLEGALVWRAKAPDKDATKGVWGNPDPGAKSLGLGCENGHSWESCDWTPASFAALKKLIENEVPAGLLREDALRRIAVLEKPPDPADHTTADAWSPLYDPKFTRAQYLAGLATTLQQAFCTAGSSPEAVAGLIQQLDYRFKNDVGQDDTGQEAKLAEVLLDEAKCPGAHGLPEEDKAKLREIRDRAPPPPGPGAVAR